MREEQHTRRPNQEISDLLINSFRSNENATKIIGLGLSSIAICLL